MLYTNVFDTLKFPGNSWQGFDYHQHDAGGALSRKEAMQREHMTLTKSSLNRSEEARATRANWGSSPMMPSYSATQRQVCMIEYGPGAKCT